jgi:hypothetical protein
LLIAALVTACASLPTAERPSSDLRVQPSADSPIGRTVLPQAESIPD